MGYLRAFINHPKDTEPLVHELHLASVPQVDNKLISGVVKTIIEGLAVGGMSSSTRKAYTRAALSKTPAWKR